MHAFTCRPLALAATVSLAVALGSSVPARADAPAEPLSLGADVAYGTLTDGVGTEYGDAGISGHGTETFAALAAGYAFAQLGRTPLDVGVDAAYLLETNRGGQMSAVGAGPVVRLDTPIYVGAGFDVYDTFVAAHTGPSEIGLFGERVRQQYASRDATVPGGEAFVGARLFAVPGATVSVQATYRFFGAGTFVPPGVLGVGLRARI